MLNPPSQEKRISIEGVRAHPWYTQPLPSRYQKALDKLSRDQHKINLTISSGKFRNAERDAALKVSRRQQQRTAATDLLTI